MAFAVALVAGLLGVAPAQAAVTTTPVSIPA